MSSIVIIRFLIILGAMAVLSCSISTKQQGPRGPLLPGTLAESALPGSLPDCAPLRLPDGFSQSILVQELSRCSSAIVTLDAVAGRSDRTDMNTVNETGEEAGRYLYRTHEVYEGRSVISVIDLQTSQTAVHAGENFDGWTSLDGIEWTPWGSLLVAEEAGAKGRLFECRAHGLDVTCVDRPAVGRMSHEGIAAAKNGTVYLGDEFDGGSIFKFVPNRYGDLSSGQVFALNVIDGGETECSGVTGEGTTPTGQAEWVALISGQNGVVTDPAVNARAAAAEAGVTKFCRPEDAEIIDGNLYVATTTTNTVFQIPIASDTPIVSEYAGINTNMKNESDESDYGLHSPDNLASDREGNLYIVEDNDGQSDIWRATPDNDQDGQADSVVLFATLTTKGAEGSGIYIPPTAPTTMYLNVQHADDGNDMTLVITQGKRHE